MKKYILLFAILISGVVQAQVSTSSVDFSNKKERKALNRAAKKQDKKNKGKLIVALNEDFDESRTLSIEGGQLWKAVVRKEFEDAFYQSGFSIIDLSTKNTSQKLSRKEKKTQKLKKRLGLLEENEDEVFELTGKETKYESTYVLRFGSANRGSAGRILLAIGTLGYSEFLIPKSKSVTNFGMQIIDLSQGGKIIARASYDGPPVDRSVFFSSVAGELRNQINTQKMNK